MKRRLELARTLMHEPKVLFMDEPSLGLDTQGRRDLWSRISELREHGMTVIMTTHYLPEAEACDRVGIIDGGRLVAVGTPEALKHEVLEGQPGTLEDVFLKLTGRAIRPEEATARDRLLGFAERGGEHTR
jgi:ABC-2 type transport system ATP-binding protein